MLPGSSVPTEAIQLPFLNVDGRREGVFLDELAPELDDVARVVLALGEAHGLVGRLDLLVEDRGLLEEPHHLVAVLGTQRAGPALVLLAQAGVLLPARLGELELLVEAVEDLELVELVRE